MEYKLYQDCLEEKCQDVFQLLISKKRKERSYILK